MSKNDGGPAAAVTMRDYFAAAALQGLCANTAIIGYSSRCGWEPVNCDREFIAQYAFRIADDAIKARVTNEN